MELCLAACQADIASLQAWHTAGATLNECDYQGKTALHVVIERLGLPDTFDPFLGCC